MGEIQALVASGLLELYILGAVSEEEAAYVERMSLLHAGIQTALDENMLALEAYSLEHAIEPDPIIKPFLMATVDYMERLQNGEAPSFPPALHQDSKVLDFKEWLDRPDMQPPAGWSEVVAKIIGYTPAMTTAIVWIEHCAPPETHTDQLESFLIVEGTCNIQLDGADNHLQPGDYFSIPLHVLHTVLITSDIPCKIIIQRAAA
jgi:mannose-6-phosphate isomerase-like protein (cupin superfamily)